MISFNLQGDYFLQEQTIVNLDPLPVREPEEWEQILQQMKAAILKNEISEARKIMYSLEFKIHEAKSKSYRDGFQHGATPLPF